VLHYLPSESSKFAVVTGRVLGNAVVRNKIKRRVTNCVRENLKSLNLPISGVFRMRADALTCEWTDFEAAVSKILGRVEP
jgi:ribonuclease P protein component